jgi:hypothetical protein
MSYGVQVFAENGDIRLDTTDRQVRFAALYTGVCPANTTISIPTALLEDDGTWGINERNYANIYIRCGLTSGNVTVTNTNTSTNYNYQVEVFRI